MRDLFCKALIIYTRMVIRSESHNLLILSSEFETYKALIDQENLSGLMIMACADPDEALRYGSRSDILFGEPTLVSRVINRLPGVRWVQCTWAGVEPLLAFGMRRDYRLTNARHVYGSMMSEYVFGYLLAIERNILSRYHSQQSADWDLTPNGTLKGKSLGLLGVGSIGAHLAGTGRHFGMRLLGYTRASETCPNIDRYFHGDQLFDFVSELDYLVCSLPETPATKALVDGRVLSALPTKAWIVNIGRGSTVDEKALVSALTDRSIRGAVLDVFEQEPLPAGHPLWTTPNTFITSHIAARNYPPDIARLFIDNYLRILRGDPLLNQVDFERGY